MTPMTTLVAVAESRGCSGWMIAMYLQGGEEEKSRLESPYIAAAVSTLPCVGCTFDTPFAHPGSPPHHTKNIKESLLGGVPSQFSFSNLTLRFESHLRHSLALS